MQRVWPCDAGRLYGVFESGGPKRIFASFECYVRLSGKSPTFESLVQSRFQI